MSDPVSKMEDVEDVLSSIRRLVADTSGSAPAESEENDPPAESAQEALILTSAQRVNVDDGTVEGAVSSLEALRKAVADPDKVSDTLVAGGWVRPTPDDYYEDEAETTQTGWAEAQAPFEGPADRPAFSPVQDGAVADEAEASPSDVEPSDSGTLGDADDTARAETEVFSARVTDEPVAPSLVEELGVATFMRSAGEAETPVKDDVEDASFVDVDIDFDEDDEPDLDAGGNILTDVPGFEDGMIDEEMLRDLVSDIVRKELGGELGERITRNVRKLVRREIHRALAEREFE